MPDAILVLNSGSSSIKFGLFDVSWIEPDLLCKGLLDEHDAQPRLTVTDASGNHLFEKRRPAADDDGRALLADILACFDTAFHHGLAPPVSRFAIPRRFEALGIRRYGFHGLSFEFISRRLAEISPALPDKRTVVAHLGNGASLCAMRNGISLDTTMGLTPLDGLMMGTRCGAIDPGVLLYLQQQQRMSVDEIQHMLYQESGLLGVSGLSADMRALLASDDPRAVEAIELFTFRVAQEVAVMANTLGGLECVVFTGGIGEHSKEIRQHICDRLQWLGVRMDRSANDQGSEFIGDKNSAVEILVIPTSEETTIARHCAATLSA
jgi:acetate kinase